MVLGAPRTLLLEEPANGLDPLGIRWPRELLRGLADRGATVLVSWTASIDLFLEKSDAVTPF